MNYYNEINPKAAAWLRELIKRKLIPAGEVDERSIENVRADDLAGFVQCHFFAGVGGWPLALRFAGWPEDRPIWTGSCPCQPFSVAGKRKGFKDERDLWPVFFNLIKECRPEIVIGEQVASSEIVGTELEASFVIAVQTGDYARANKLANKLVKNSSLHYWKRWLDRVCANMEEEGYTVGACVLGAHSVGAPHRRQRLYWGATRVAQDSAIVGRGGRDNGDSAGDDGKVQAAGLGDGRRLALSESRGCVERKHRNKTSEKPTSYCGGQERMRFTPSANAGANVGLVNNHSQRLDREPAPNEQGADVFKVAGNGLESLSPWSDFGLVLCTDNKVRRIPIKSVLFGVADGVSEGVDGGGDSGAQGFPLSEKIEGHKMLIEGYGNAIVPQLGAEFIRAFMENEKKERS